MSAAELVARLADKNAALESIEVFDALFTGATAMAKISLYVHIPKLMDACGDKQKSVSTAAATLVKKMYAECGKYSGGYVLPLLRDSLAAKAKPEVKVVACEIVTDFATKHSESMALEIEWCVHLLSILMNDVKKNVKDKALEAMKAVASCSGNRDLEKFTQTIVKAQQSAKNVPECVEELAGCIFVQNVEAPALAVITPVLVRGLSERSDVTKRRCCVIVDNMCKLIDDPREGSPLMAEVRTLVNKATESISDPDAREMSERAHGSILKLVDAGPYVEQDFKAFATKVGLPVDDLDVEQAAYCSKVAYQLVRAKRPARAGEAFTVFGFDATSCESIVESMSNVGAADEIEFVDEDEASPDLYRGSFTLAYGTLSLIHI